VVAELNYDHRIVIPVVTPNGDVIHTGGIATQKKVADVMLEDNTRKQLLNQLNHESVWLRQADGETRTLTPTA